jgi:hypothetical protein
MILFENTKEIDRVAVWRGGGAGFPADPQMAADED